MNKKSTLDILIEKTIHLIKEALTHADYANSICLLFGLSSDDVPNQNALFLQLLEFHKEYHQLYLQVKEAQKKGHSLRVINLDENLAKFELILEQTRSTKEIWKNGPIKILCSDSQLLSLALEVKEKGYVNLSKAELEKYFDLTNVVNFWACIPTYTSFLLGGGIAVSSPESDLFQSMGWAFNETVKTSRDVSIYKEQLGTADIDFTAYGDKIGLHSIMCRQALINAFLLIEAFINSVADAGLADKTKDLTEEQRMYLKEQAKDRNGQVRQKFVPIENKLFEWTKILSPTGETFNKGSNPFQEFMGIKEYRDATVHLAATKVNNFRSIDFKVASKAVLLALEIIKLISEYTASDINNVEYPFWFAEPGSDGLFHLSRTLELKVKGSTPRKMK